jgi:hypothetical protein
VLSTSDIVYEGPYAGEQFRFLPDTYVAIKENKYGRLFVSTGASVLREPKAGEHDRQFRLSRGCLWVPKVEQEPHFPPVTCAIPNLTQILYTGSSKEEVLAKRASTDIAQASEKANADRERDLARVSMPLPGESVLPLPAPTTIGGVGANVVGGVIVYGLVAVLSETDDAIMFGPPSKLKSFDELVLRSFPHTAK